MAKLANAHHFEFNESTSIQNVPAERPNLGDFGGEDIDKIQSDNDSEMMDETKVALMDEYDIDVNLLADEFSTYLYYEI